MARLKFGPWGGIIGKLGNHVGYIRKGIAVLRMNSHPSTKKRSVGQKATTQRFQLIIKLIATMNNFTNMGFGPAAKKVSPTAQNLAVSYNTKNAIIGEYPDQEIDYSKLKLAEGDLPLPDAIEVTVEDLGDEVKLHFTWETGTDLAYERNRDQVMILAYLPQIKKTAYLDGGARRPQGQDSLLIPKKEGAKRYPTMITYAETYLAFVSNDRESVSDSIYCGRIEF